MMESDLRSGDTMVQSEVAPLSVSGADAAVRAAGMPMLQVNDLSKEFRVTSQGDSHGKVAAVNAVSFEIHPGEFFTLVGPSGCGKTTTLRCIAGLETPDAGKITIGGRTLYSKDQGINVSANLRQLGMVFQSYAIWPHMTVAQNVAFPVKVTARRRKLSKADLRQQVERALAVVQLGHLYDRPATDLSGGQQQRLALARALVTAPPLLLLDEPLSNLDARLRADMRLELRRLQNELNVTTLYVTHDQSEALALSNVIGVMYDGVIQQLGSPAEIYERPTSPFVAGFIGVSNFLEGVVAHPPVEGLYPVTTKLGLFHGYSEVELNHGESVVLTCRPEQIAVIGSSDGPTLPNHVTGRVRATAYLGDVIELLATVNDTDLRVLAKPNARVEIGEDIALQLDPKQCRLLRSEK
jgi:iron(III) transport system ATP-binding protein